MQRTIQKHLPLPIAAVGYWPGANFVEQIVHHHLDCFINVWPLPEHQPGLETSTVLSSMNPLNGTRRILSSRVMSHECCTDLVT